VLYWILAHQKKQSSPHFIYNWVAKGYANMIFEHFGRLVNSCMKILIAINVIKIPFENTGRIMITMIMF
jgi:hypothetical protein